jgi:hypothetical protein
VYAIFQLISAYIVLDTLHKIDNTFDNLGLSINK